jgi:hypothetical protein
MADDQDDPLAGADVGETREIEVTDRQSLTDTEPTEFWGSDRLGGTDEVEAEMVVDENGERWLDVTYRGEVTKRLPRRWDSRRPDAVVDSYKRASKWRYLGVRIGWILGVMAVSAYVAAHIASRLDGTTITMNNPLAAGGLVFPAVMAVVLAALIGWAIVNAPRRMMA